MTTTDRIKWFRDYFNVQMSEADFRKCEEMLKAESIETIVEKKVVKVVYKEKEIPVRQYMPAKIVSLMQHFNLVCELYNVDPDKCLKPNRNERYVKAKAHFVREVKMSNPKTTARFLARFLNYKDHSPINHLLYRCQINIPIPPLPANKRK